MRFKNLIQNGLIAILTSSLALASPNLPRGYKNVKFGSSLNDVQTLYSGGDIWKNTKECENEEAGISKENMIYITDGEISGLNLRFCFPKSSESKLAVIILNYKLNTNEILNLLENIKKKYGLPMKEEFGDKFKGSYCTADGENAVPSTSQYFSMYWVDNQTRLQASGFLYTDIPYGSHCDYSTLGIRIIDRVPSTYNKSDTLP